MKINYTRSLLLYILILFITIVWVIEFFEYILIYVYIPKILYLLLQHFKMQFPKKKLMQIYLHASFLSYIFLEIYQSVFFSRHKASELICKVTHTSFNFFVATHAYDFDLIQLNSFLTTPRFRCDNLFFTHAKLVFFPRPEKSSWKNLWRREESGIKVHIIDGKFVIFAASKKNLFRKIVK